MTVEAYAKVNLTLEVYGKRPDGYHALRSVVQPISLSDTLEVERTDDGSISSDTGYGEKCLVVKAARSLRARFPGATGCRVRVTKRIPAGGGLGGGSADAAATLRALNVLWKLGRAPEELAEIGASVGSDVPALVLAQHFGGPVLMEGRGERVTRLVRSASPSAARLLDFVDALPPFLVLANPGVSSSTPEVYALCTPRPGTPSAEPDACLVNDLEAPAVSLHPEIAALLRALREAGARDVLMSGSGSTVFGFAESEETSRRIVALLKDGEGKSPHCQIAIFRQGS